MLPVLVNLEDRKKSQRNVEDFHLNPGRGLNEAIAFSDGRSNGDSSHHLIKGADLSS